MHATYEQLPISVVPGNCVADSCVTMFKGRGSKGAQLLLLVPSAEKMMLKAMQYDDSIGRLIVN